MLVPGGRFIVTTPRRIAEPLIALYSRGVREEHKGYYDRAGLRELAGSLFDVLAYRTFLFGMNQVVCYRRRPAG